MKFHYHKKIGKAALIVVLSMLCTITYPFNVIADSGNSGGGNSGGGNSGGGNSGGGNSGGGNSGGGKSGGASDSKGGNASDTGKANRGKKGKSLDQIYIPYLESERKSYEKWLNDLLIE